MVAPRLTDRIMEVIMYTGQQSRTRKSDADHKRALYHAGYGGHERGTHEPHLLRSSSLYVKATKRPTLAAAIVLGGGALAMAALRSARPDEAGPPRVAGDMAQIEPDATNLQAAE